MLSALRNKLLSSHNTSKDAEVNGSPTANSVKSGKSGVVPPGIGLMDPALRRKFARGVQYNSESKIEINIENYFRLY